VAPTISAAAAKLDANRIKCCKRRYTTSLADGGVVAGVGTYRRKPTAGLAVVMGLSP
jgi:hypothetical protein